MKHTDAELIQHTLAGDETAFAELVKRHQKPVHTLAWRKIGDFQIAEEITQDTFLKVYQRLHTLKDPNQFSGWLYVIATRRCYAWLRKKRIRTDPLEDVNTTMIHKDAYSHHVIEDRRNSAVDAHREAVKKLLAKLKESERTVMTLHYLGEMTVEEISKFIGVSAGTIKSRLQRARNRLQKEETMIREALEHFQISPNLTDNIMQEVARLKPTPSGSKPLIPWAVAASTAVLIVLMLGIGNQHLARFQKPYSLDAQSEMSVELVEAPIVPILELESDVRRQFGNTPAAGKSDTPRQNPDEILFASAQVQGENMSNQKQQWIHAKRVKGAPIMNLSTTPDGDLYAFANYLSVYRQSKDTNTWQHLSSINKLRTDWGGDPSIAKWNNTLYFSISNNFYSSTDDGETWDLIYSWKKGQYAFPIKFIITEGTFYLAFRNGVFQSDDNGKTWKNISDGLKGRSVHFIKSLINIQNTVFVGANDGCYRYNGNDWERLEFPSKIFSVVSTAADAGKLYVMAELSWKVNQEFKRTWGIFRSTNLGDSWEDITPTHAWQLDGNRPNIVLIAIGETLLAMEHGMVRSLDSGDTWLNPQTQDTSPSMGNLSPVAVMNDQTIYVGSDNGLYSSTDLGVSWNKINIRENGGRIYNLIALKKTDKSQSPSLYAIVNGETLAANEIQKTDDTGNSWKRVQIARPMTDPIRRINPDSTQIVKSGDVLYAKGKDAIGGVKKVYIHRVSSDGKTLERIQGMPVFSSEKLDEQLAKGQALGATQFFKQLTQTFEGDEFRKKLIENGLRGAFAVDKDTFYIDFNYKLFRWKLGDTELYDTEQEETIELSEDIIKRNLKIAVSGNTIYVGKRDGHFVVSFDRGTNWIDFTPALPFAVNDYKQILIAGTTVYVATDAGIITSDDGRSWNTITDAAGDNLIMEHLANDGNTLYGVTEKSGIYRLENGSWHQILYEIPDDITSMAVDGNTLYVGTRNQGMLHYTFE